ncbi:MAG: hypothetical protein ACE5H5_02250 [Nitrospinota bacterium]
MNGLAKTRKKSRPSNGQLRNSQPQVRKRQATSPTGKVVVVSRGQWPTKRSLDLPPCLRGHRATPLVP